MNKKAFPALVLCAVLLGGGIGYAAAENDKLKDAFKKTERGFGSLLEGMGQELKKAQKKISRSAEKKEEKKR
jgi:hypothetical protein